MIAGTEIVVTDYGDVRLSQRTLDWLRSIDPDWRSIAANKRYRGKHAQYVRAHVCRLEDAVGVAAAIASEAGDVLEEF